jgi:hypothetical protein
MIANDGSFSYDNSGSVINEKIFSDHCPDECLFLFYCVHILK